MAPGRAPVDEVARRSVPTPLRRGTAVVAVAGGAFSLIGAAAPGQAPAVADAPGPALLSAAAVLPAEATLVLPAVEPVAPAPDVVDAAGLVKAVQVAEQEIARVAAEKAAAEERAARERAAQEKAAQEKAAQERTARAAATPRRVVQAATGSPGCDLDTSGLGAVLAHVRAAAEFLGCLFGEPAMHGVAGRAGTSDHPSGKALDFMVDRATGDALAECALRNKAALGITYVIWRQRINYGSGWEAMEDRGSVTANHFDHVHVSFGSGAGSGTPGGC